MKMEVKYGSISLQNYLSKSRMKEKINCNDNLNIIIFLFSLISFKNLRTYGKKITYQIFSLLFCNRQSLSFLFFIYKTWEHTMIFQNVVVVIFLFYA